MAALSPVSTALSGADSVRAADGRGNDPSADGPAFDAVLAHSVAAASADTTESARDESIGHADATSADSTDASANHGSTRLTRDETAAADDPQSAVDQLLMLLPESVLPPSVPPAMPPVISSGRDGITADDAGALPDHVGIAASSLSAGRQADRGGAGGGVGIGMRAARTPPGGESRIAAMQDAGDATRSLADITASAGAERETQTPVSTSSATASAVMTAMTTTAASTAPMPSPANLSLPSPLGTPGWRQEFSQQIHWMARTDMQVASLSLNPPELGPVRVELQLSGAEATARFTSPLPEVRLAIESALPELKASMEASGLTLSGATVGHGQPDKRPPATPLERQSAAAGSDAEAEGSDGLAAPDRLRAHPHRLLDLYA